MKSQTYSQVILCFLFLIFGFATQHKQTNEEKQDATMTAIIDKMGYNEYCDIPNNQFGYFIDRIRASERSGKVVQLGNEEFNVYHYNDSTDAYPYRLEGKAYTLEINPKSVFEDKFTVMKTWNENQDEYYTQDRNLWTIIRSGMTSFMNSCFDNPFIGIATFYSFLLLVFWVISRRDQQET